MNVGGVFLLAFIGSLAMSAQAQAAYVVSYTQLFSFITWTSVGIMGATAAVSGQNLGAGRPDRTSQAVRTASGFGLMVAAVIGSAFLFIPNLLLGIFGMDDPVVRELSIQLLRYLAISGLFITVALAYTGGLQGTGDTKSPMYISFISQIFIPLGMCFLIRAFSTLDPGDIWLAIVLGHVTRATLSVIVFRRERWRDIHVAVGSVQA
jgi:Na+-driven multidrug efflux pump